MSPRARARLFLVRRVPPVLLILAIAAYGAMLYAAHAASRNAGVETRYVQRLAESPDQSANVIGNAREGALLLEPLPSGGARAQWRLRSLAGTLAPGTVVQSEDAFVTGLDISLFAPNSEATISLDGKQLGHFRPLFLEPDDEGPYAVAHAPLGGIDIPPGYTTGFRFPLAAPGACVASDCTLRIAVKNATWVVRRVGLIFSVVPPAAPALWKRPGAVWLVICFALALAVASHVALSARLGRSGPSSRAHRTAG